MLSKLNCLKLIYVCLKKDCVPSDIFGKDNFLSNSQ